jgi:stage III sporulation protein SpoIIIAA
LAGKEITDDLDLLLGVMPPHISYSLSRQPDLKNLIEVVMDLGRQPEAHFPGRAAYLGEATISREDIEYAVHRVGSFTQDNRAGIERTLHRISCIRNRRDIVIGLTCRVGRAVYGTVDVLRDVIESGKSLLLLGRPGIGKTTLLRESARVLPQNSRSASSLWTHRMKSRAMETFRIRALARAGACRFLDPIFNMPS